MGIKDNLNYSLCYFRGSALQQSSLSWGSVCCWGLICTLPHLGLPIATGHCVIRILILLLLLVEGILEVHYWTKCPFGSQPGIFSLDFTSVSALIMFMVPSFLEFADLWSGVRIPACCTVPACRVWPVPSHTGRRSAHSWQHYCQRWVWHCAGSVITNNINNAEFTSCSKLRVPYIGVWRHQWLHAGGPDWSEDEWLFGWSHSLPPTSSTQHIDTTVRNSLNLSETFLTAFTSSPEKDKDKERKRFLFLGE